MNELLQRPVSPPVATKALLRSWTFWQWLLSVASVSCVLGWLLLMPESHGKSDVVETVAGLSVEAIGSNEIAVDMQAPIGKKLELLEVVSETVTEPLLEVTGSILASRRPGRNGEPDYWQFRSTELLTTYTEYEKAVADLDFATAQLGRIKELAATKEQAQQREIERSEKLVKSGTEAARDLSVQRASLLETHISNQKDIYEAETAIKTARRNLTSFSIQLLQAGLDPELLRTATSEMDVVGAEVPEGKIGIVSTGQSCTARFFGFPNSAFSGKVIALSPVLSSENRTLRVIFVLHDPHDELRPGMFAEIGIGIDPRLVIRVPATSVIHIGRQDYVFLVNDQSPQNPKLQANVAEGRARTSLKGQAVEVSESFVGSVEIVKGLQAGDRIVSGSVILLKPALVTALLDSVPSVRAPRQQGSIR